MDYVSDKGPDAAIAMRHNFDIVLRKFCTLGHGAPLRAHGAPLPTKFDEKLYQHLVKIHEMWDTDADPVMLLAGSEATSETNANSAALQNNKIRLMDPTHAARRILSRPWESHPETKEIIDTLIRDGSSITQRIRHSDMFTQWFSDHLTDMEDSVVRESFRKIHNVSSAAHRFDSVIEPLVRIVLLFPAFVAVAHKIMVHRKSSQASNDMASFLSFVSGEVGRRRLVLLAMMADGGLEIMSFVRWFDSSDYDIAAVSAEINKLVVKLTWLFVEKNVTTFPEGCTAHMLRTLATPRLCVVAGGPTPIGGRASSECVAGSAECCHPGCIPEVAL